MIWLAALNIALAVAGIGAYFWAERELAGLRFELASLRRDMDAVRLKLQASHGLESRLTQVIARIDNMEDLRKRTAIAPDPTPPQSPPPAPAPRPVDLERASSDAFSEWCRTGREPELPAGIGAVPFQYAGFEQADEFSARLPLFEDAPAVSEFVRFFRSDGGNGSLVYPHPETVYKNSIRHLFADLSESQFSSYPRPHLASTRPVRLIRRADGKWTRPQ